MTIVPGKKSYNKRTLVQFSSVQLLSHPTLCNPMNHSTPGLPVHQQLPESTQSDNKYFIRNLYVSSNLLKKAERQRIDVFELWCWRRLLRVPLDCKEIQPIHPKGDQSWVFIGRTDAEAETTILWPTDAMS